MRPCRASVFLQWPRVFAWFDDFFPWYHSCYKDDVRPENTPLVWTWFKFFTPEPISDMLVCMFFFFFAKEPTNRFGSEFFREPHHDHKNAVETIYLTNVGVFLVLSRYAASVQCAHSPGMPKADGDSPLWRHLMQITSTSAGSHLCLYLSRWFCSCWCCCAGAARSTWKSTKTPKKKKKILMTLMTTKKLFTIYSTIDQKNIFYWIKTV